MRAALPLALLLATASHADVQMPNWFGDNMILQTNNEYGARSFLNGIANPNEVVTIGGTATNAVYKVTADSAGQWEVMLDPMGPKANAGYLTVQGETGPVHKASNVSYGDVFFCSGQSNMQFPLKYAFNATEEAASLNEAEFKNFRFFTAAETYSKSPQFDFKNGTCQVGDGCLKWVTAEEAVESGYIMDFSAVCYMTVRDVARFHTGSRPMGLVLSTWGGTRIEAWTPPAGLAACASTPPPAMSAEQNVSALYNGMVAPVNKMTVRAALWYQGEANADEKLPSGYDRESYYSCMLQGMVAAWRDLKAIGDFPFIAMQLPPSVPAGTPAAQQQNTGRPAIRLAEADLVPRTGSKTDISGIAVGIDLGGVSAWGVDHPPNKNEMARRLALQTVHIAYAVQGRQTNEKAGTPPFPVNSYPSGPVFGDAAVSGADGSVTVSFTNGTGFALSLRDVHGLNINGSSDSCTLCCAGGGAPFEVLVGGTWVQVPFASTKVVGDAVVLGGGGQQPAAVRYAHTDFVECVVQNGDGLPLGPFVHTFAQQQEELVVAQPYKAGQIVSPPLGFNSWNFYHCNIDEVTVKAVIDVMVSNGMRDAGYEYVNIDDCWQVARMPNGTIIPDPVRFPSGMRALADYAHSKGMKFGVYTAQAQYTCQSRPGSYNFETIDGDTYCEWGVDYLKIDECDGKKHLAKNTSWIRFHDAFESCYNRTGRWIVTSVEHCDEPELCGRWIPGLANLWRTSKDVQAHFSSVMYNAYASDKMRHIASPGHFNDADMLEVGDVGLSYVEQVTHFSLWCIIASPLLAGTDLIHIKKQTLDILTNKEAIVVNQDLGLDNKIQGYLMKKQEDSELWYKPLADKKTRAVLLINMNEAKNATLSIDFKELGVAAGGKQAVRDLWLHKDMGTFSSSYTAHDVPPHGVAFVTLTEA